MPAPASGAPSRPRGPQSASTPSAATSVGTTKGSINRRSTSERLRNSSRASTQATGRPSARANTQVMAAWVRDHNTRQRRKSSCQTSSQRSGSPPDHSPPPSPSTSSRSTGATSSSARKTSGSAGNRWRDLNPCMKALNQDTWSERWVQPEHPWNRLCRATRCVPPPGGKPQSGAGGSLKNHLGPALQPGLAFAVHISDTRVVKRGGFARVLLHHLHTRGPGFGRKHPHRGLQRLLGRSRAQELDELARGIARGRVATLDQRHPLDLAEHTALEEQVGGG